jgi:hypothetical protein
MYVLATKTSISKFINWTNIHPERTSKRVTLESFRNGKTTSKIAINCQSIVSLQSTAYESNHNHLICGAPLFSSTAYIRSSFLYPLSDNVSLRIDTIVAYSYQPQHLFWSILK